MFERFETQDQQEYRVFFDAVVYLVRKKLTYVAKEEAEAAVQEAFARLFERFKQGNLEVRGEGFQLMVASAVNACIDSLRKEHRNKSTAAGDIDYLPQSQLNPDFIYTEFETLKDLYQAIFSLPREQQTVVLFHNFFGISLREIAEWENISVSSVKSRHRRAKISLRKKLEGKFVL